LRGTRLWDLISGSKGDYRVGETHLERGGIRKKQKGDFATKKEIDGVEGLSSSSSDKPKTRDPPPYSAIVPKHYPTSSSSSSNSASKPPTYSANNMAAAYVAAVYNLGPPKVWHFPSPLEAHAWYREHWSVLTQEAMANGKQVQLYVDSFVPV
jgi:hypothetical protein